MHNENINNIINSTSIDIHNKYKSSTEITTCPSYRYIKKQGWKKCKNRIIRIGTYDCWASVHNAQTSMLNKRFRWILTTLMNENLDIIALQRVSLPLLHYIINHTVIYNNYYVSSTKQPWKYTLSKNVKYEGMEPNCWPVTLTKFEPFTTHHIRDPNQYHCIATIVDLGFLTFVNIDLDTNADHITINKNNSTNTFNVKNIEYFEIIQSHIASNFNTNKICYAGNFNFDLGGSSQMYPEKKIIQNFHDAWYKCQENVTGLFVDTSAKKINGISSHRTDGTMGYTMDTYENSLLFNIKGHHIQSRKHAILYQHPTLVALKIKRFGTNAVFTVDAEQFASRHHCSITKTTKHGRVIEYFPSIYFGVVCTFKY